MDKQNLIIGSLGIKDFRSFDSEGIFLEDLRKINYLIGKNNSGKSNVLRFLKTLYDALPNFTKFPNSSENQHHNSNLSASISQKVTLSNLNFPKRFQSRDHQGNLINLNISDFLTEEIEFQYNFINHTFEILAAPKSKKWDTFDYYKDEIGIAIANEFQINLRNISPWDAVKNHYQEKYFQQILRIAKHILYIPDKRIIQENNNIERSNSEINGTNLISKLSRMKNYGIGEDDDYANFKAIEQKISEILDVKKVEIQIPEKKSSSADQNKTLVLVVDNKRHLLQNYGTGVHDLVMFCCLLMLNKKSLVCIEEPELHMHPELQRRFLKFLEETQHQYIIATHSNIFLDSLNTNSAIYHVKYDGVKSSITKSVTDNVIREIIDDLGFKASDLLQSNGIIWVEGPSDRTYLNKWMSMINPEIKEGIHYTIMFYGGKLLSHLSFEFDEENELIKMMKVNPNAFILMDKDTSDINKTKKRIQSELGESNTWITRGKEIENYIPKSVLNKWLEKKGFKKVEIENSLKTKFENLIKANNPTFKYESKKSVYAKQITDFYELDDLNHHDLTTELKKVIAVVRKWNEFQ